MHAEPLIVGFNCALGGKALRPHVQELARVAPVFVSAYPNAGLPNEFGNYDETAQITASVLRASPEQGRVIWGGGGGGPPRAHSRAFPGAVPALPPRRPPELPH